MRKYLISVAVLSLATGSEAQARHNPPPVNLDGIPLAQMCRSDGALELQFGSGAVKLMPTTMHQTLRRKLGAEFAPFDRAELSATKYSQKFYSVSYEADLGSPEQAQWAARTLAAKLDRTAWHDMPKYLGADDPLPEADPETGDLNLRFYSKSELGDPPAADETTLEIDSIGSHLTVICDNAPLAMAQMDEALGKMPIGTPRPKPEDFAVDPVSYVEADCDEPAKMKEIVELMGADNMLRFMPEMARGQYEQALADWKVMKLTSSGKISFDEITDKLLNAYFGPDIDANLDAALGPMDKMLKALDGVDLRDDKAACRAALKGMDAAQSDAAPSNAGSSEFTAAQKPVHALLDKEAARLGVSFDG